MTPEEIRALRAEARVARNERRYDAAGTLEQRAADACAALGDAAGQAHARRHVADIAAEAGDAARAEPIYAEVLSFYETENTSDAANAFRAAAVNAEALGDRDGALARWTRARDLYRANDAWFRERTGHNPGEEEADGRIAALTASG